MEYGKAFGEFGMMNNSKRSATIICIEDTFLLKLDKTNYDNIMKYYYLGK